MKTLLKVLKAILRYLIVTLQLLISIPTAVILLNVFILIALIDVLDDAREVLKE